GRVAQAFRQERHRDLGKVPPGRQNWPGREGRSRLAGPMCLRWRAESPRLAVPGGACDLAASVPPAGEIRRAPPALGARVPRYFFHVVHPTSEPDGDGHDFPDIYAAQAAAVRLCGEILRDIEGKFWDNPVWRLEVRSHEERLLFTLTFTAEEHEATGLGTSLVG